MVAPQIELAEGTEDVVAGDRRVETHEKFSKVPQDNGRIQVRPNSLVWEETVHDVEWQWSKEANQICRCDPLVASTNGKHLGSNGPSNGECVELLDLGTRPDVGTFRGLENGCLVFDDAKDCLDQVTMFVHRW